MQEHCGGLKNLVFRPYLIYVAVFKPFSLKLRIQDSCTAVL